MRRMMKTKSLPHSSSSKSLKTEPLAEPSMEPPTEPLAKSSASAPIAPSSRGPCYTWKVKPVNAFGASGRINDVWFTVYFTAATISPPHFPGGHDSKVHSGSSFIIKPDISVG